MRTIAKGGSAHSLSVRHQNPPQTSEQATAAWGHFRDKQDTRDNCLVEQYHLCGYSEVDLENRVAVFDASTGEVSRALGMHLEHIVPKSAVPQRTFDHDNLIVSAIDDVKARELLSEEVFGGHAKQSWYHADFIHPLLQNCRDYFFFEASTGKVVPRIELPRRERAKARLTIYKLNLNSPVLRLWRKTWLLQLEALIDDLLLAPKALEDFCEQELLPINGHLRPFHSAQRQLFGKLGQQVCLRHNPPL